MNGPISVERTPGNSAEVLVEKRWEHSTPQSVRLVALPGTSGVTICAVWGDEASCDPEGHYEAVGGRGHRNDVAVRFKVLVPKGVAADVTTMDGALQIAGVTGALDATTLSGGIQAEVAGGPVTVKTVNVSIEATLGALASGGARIETVNGSVTVRLPEHVNATLDAGSVVGHVQADVPLQLTGSMDPRHVQGSLGKGGPTLHVSTVNGEIRLLQIGSGIEVPPPAHRKRFRLRIPSPPSAPAPAQPQRERGHWGSQGGAGRVNETVRPGPAARRGPVCPRCGATSRCESASPSPVPSYCRLADASSWVNSLNSFGWSSGAMPMPLSWTST